METKMENEMETGIRKGSYYILWYVKVHPVRTGRNTVDGAQKEAESVERANEGTFRHSCGQLLVLILKLIYDLVVLKSYGWLSKLWSLFGYPKY